MGNDVLSVLTKNLESKIHHKAEKGMFFPKDYISEKYINLFGITDRRSFVQAFDIVAYGQGSEIAKINSLQSSSLLSLLVFHPLFNGSACPIVIDGTKYNRCFFEIKNNVIRLPSCIDVVLWSEEEKKLLFLESKFTEYNALEKKQSYGIGYLDLYRDLQQNQVFYPYLSVAENAEKHNDSDNAEVAKKMEIISADDNKKYIEGIKQSISHLIGIVRGPYCHTNEAYPKSYLEDYVNVYQQANELIYGTILFDPHQFDPHDELKESENFDNYFRLYRDIIGRKGNLIVDLIRSWCSNKYSVYDKEKKITVLSDPLTYQNVAHHSPSYFESLPSQVLDFYGFNHP